MPAHPFLGSSIFVKHRLLILVALFDVCGVFYYFGQLVDFFNWTTLRWEFFYEVHDTYRLFFLIPIIYACYYFGFKQGLIVNVASLIVFLPRAILISPFPDSVVRALIFTAFSCVLCIFLRIGRNKIQQYTNGMDIDKNVVYGFIQAQSRVFAVGDLEVDLSKRVVKRHGEIIKLTPKEYDLLSYFIRNTGRALNHAELLHNVWGPEYGQESEYLRTFIWQLRHKLEDDPTNPQFILTESGVGYRFVEPERH
jgi:DNA-binding winged helix-turn-helix (wHTH) protein